VVAFAYDGGPFHGAQPQPDRPTAGGALLDRIEAAAGHRPKAFTLTARTDAGVHARIALATCWLAPGSPVPHDAEQPRPDGLGPVVIRGVSPSVYARGLAGSKRYAYTVHDGADVADPPWDPGQYEPIPAGGPRAWRVAGTLDLEAMRAAADALRGTHDFTALRGPGGHTADPHKTLSRLDVVRTDTGVELTFEADAFLRKMVRNLTALVVAVGLGERHSDEIPQVLASRNPRRGAWPAPPHGLVLAALHIDPAGVEGDGAPRWWTRPEDLAMALPD
jgi:tRNA pseudouridine38-40 synthase